MRLKQRHPQASLPASQRVYPSELTLVVRRPPPPDSTDTSQSSRSSSQGFLSSRAHAAAHALVPAPRSRYVVHPNMTFVMSLITAKDLRREADSQPGPILRSARVPRDKSAARSAALPPAMTTESPALDARAHPAALAGAPTAAHVPSQRPQRTAARAAAAAAAAAAASASEDCVCCICGRGLPKNFKSSWPNVVRLTLYANMDGPPMSSRAISNFIRQHWETFFPGQTRSASWTNTVTSTLSRNWATFEASDAVAEHLVWKLRSYADDPYSADAGRSMGGSMQSRRSNASGRAKALSARPTIVKKAPKNSLAIAATVAAASAVASASASDAKAGDGRRCAYCQTSSTVLWRQGPGGKGTLCNACGVKWKRGILRVPIPSEIEGQENPPALVPRKKPAKTTSSTSSRARSISSGSRSSGEA